MTAKLIGVVLFVICGGIIGYGRLREIKRQLAVIEEMDSSLALMESEIALCERSLPDIFENLTLKCAKHCSGAFSKMRDVCLVSSAGEAWRGGVETLELVGEAENALLALGGVLGATDGKRQSAEIANARITLLAVKEKLSKEMNEKGKSYPLLGFCIAGIVALMLV
ncbi:MAG: hypothetical protein E7420_00890 [Ruminococcaceae bacterium]|nr:hypothetical protein [Oscillospiraceae bacterium]